MGSLNLRKFRIHCDTTSMTQFYLIKKKENLCVPRPVRRGAKFGSLFSSRARLWPNNDHHWSTRNNNNNSSNIHNRTHWSFWVSSSSCPVLGWQRAVTAAVTTTNDGANWSLRSLHRSNHKNNSTNPPSFERRYQPSIVRTTTTTAAARTTVTTRQNNNKNSKNNNSSDDDRQ